MLQVPWLHSYPKSFACIEETLDVRHPKCFECGDPLLALEKEMLQGTGYGDCNGPVHPKAPGEETLQAVGAGTPPAETPQAVGAGTPQSPRVLRHP